MWKDLMTTWAPPLGYTYALASSPYDGWAKIGRSKGTPAARLRGCQTGNPRRLTLAAVWAIDCEEALHAHYAPLRGVGEWFALPLGMLEHMASVWGASSPLVHLTLSWPLERALDLAAVTAGISTAEVTPEIAARALMTEEPMADPLAGRRVVELHEPPTYRTRKAS